MNIVSAISYNTRAVQTNDERIIKNLEDKDMKIAVLGLGNRGQDVYIAHLSKYPDVEFSAICDINSEAIKSAVSRFNLKSTATYSSEEAFFAAGKMADALIIATLDKDHYKQAMRALDLGYHLLLEKPVSDKQKEVEDIANKAKELNLTVLVCHVLRYSPYYIKIKEILDSGVIGDVMSITHQENIGYWHFAHSYCRGNWRNSETSAPMLLAKCCHDFDLFQWFIDKPCVSISSIGGLNYFTKEYKPQGATETCLGGCPHYNTCPYSVKKIYLDKTAIMHFSKRHVTGISQCTQEQYVEKLKTNSYGKCVYNTDNNVCDHQTVSMLFEGNITVTMAVSAFSKDCYRNIHIHGTKGEIVGKDSDEVLILNVFGGKRKKIKTKARGAGHLGGDYGICRTFHQLMKNEPIDKNYLTTIDVTLLSHKIVFGAEESRKNGGQLIKL